MSLLFGGTDKHYLICKTTESFGLDGTSAERRLEQVGLLANRQWLPTDVGSTSRDCHGLRLGTPWIASRGYEADDVAQLATLVIDALSGTRAVADVASDVTALAARPRPGDVWGESNGPSC